MGTKIMSERFTETLRGASEPGWSHAVGHRFVKELFAGTLADTVMARYLIQDHRFLESFLILLGAALASTDTFERQAMHVSEYLCGALRIGHDQQRLQFGKEPICLRRGEGAPVLLARQHGAHLVKPQHRHQRVLAGR